MSDNINFSGSIQRFLKGDADPINLFGLNPNRAELRANEADRSRRASQISAEQGSPALRAAGGSIDAPTRQVRKLRANEKTGNRALSPFNPVPLPSVTLTAAAIEEKSKDRKRSESRTSLAARNKKHADTGLFAPDRSKKAPASTGQDNTRFSERRLRRSILGGSRHT